MKILVTGATGFIGKRLVRRLRGKGCDIVCLVRKESRVEGLEEMGVTLAVGEITDPEQVNEIFHNEHPGFVFHCAARVRETKEENIYRINVSGTQNISEACYRYGVNRLIYLSSVAVVTGNPEIPLVDDLPYKATSVYGRSKIEAEKIVLDYRRKGLHVAILRPCMVYGEDEPHALDKMFNLVSRRLIPVPGLKRISDKLHIGYVDNVVYAMELAMEKEGALEGTFFIADKEVITIRKFLEIVSDELNAERPFIVPGWIVRLGLLLPPLRNRFNRIYKDRVYDITPARDLLGYNPKISTEDGLRRTARHWMEKKSHSKTSG